MNYKYLLHKAYLEAKKSHDKSTQNGALLANGNGTPILESFNTIPRDVKITPEREQRPLKYKFTEHAERNVIYKAASEGYPTYGMTMVCPWAACSDCARAIIQSGIKTLITHKLAHDRSPPFWQEEIDIAFEMFNEAGVEVIMFSDPIGNVEIRHCGVLWKP